MRTIIDIPEEKLKPLDALRHEEGLSRAEIIRQAIDMFLMSKEKKRKKVTLEDAFGLFKDNSPFGDGLEYQLKIRSEWDERDRAINEWSDYLKSHPIQIPKIKRPKKPK